jgi:hypothetical protein
MFQMVSLDAPPEGAATRGAVAPHAIVALGGGGYFFLNETGFYLNDEYNAIGAERVDAWFFADIDPAKLGSVQAAADPFKKIVWVRYQDQASTYKMIGYDWQLDRWTYSNIPAQLLVSTATPGVVLDTLTGFLDDYPEPLDSSFWEGGQVTFGCFREDNILYLFANEKADAVIETSTVELSPNSVAWLTGALLKANLSGYTIQAGKAMLPGDTLSWSASTPISSRTGAVPIRSSGRYHRFRVNITAGGNGTHIHGVEALFQNSGVQGGP